MDILLLDFETTGLDTSEARIIEVGAMLVDEEFNQSGLSFSSLVYSPEYGQITKEIEDITGITQEMLEHRAIKPFEMWDTLSNLFPVDFVIAHNVAYDQGIFRSEMARIQDQLELGYWAIDRTKWLCSMKDIEANKKSKHWNLSALALHYGVTVNPDELHRAIGDVELMRKMLKASGTTVQEMLTYHEMPSVILRAFCEAPWKDGGASSGLVKKAGYSWERAIGDTTERVHEKCWVKLVKQKDVETEMARPFKVQAI